MRKPPDKKTTEQSDQVKPNLRWSRQLHASLQAEADRNERSLNAEVIARLRENPVELLRQENAELRGMVREILDIVRDKL